MHADVEAEGEASNEPRSKEKRQKNIVIIGVMAAGKSSVAWRLARMIGYGCLDIDEGIVSSSGKTIEQLFREDGESVFRQFESAAIRELKSLRNHVIAVGGGAVLDDENWAQISHLGTTVWLNAPPSEVARRLVMKPGEIRGRPLLADIANIEDKQMRFVALHDRVEALVGQRRQRYSQADVVVEDAYSTPESAALKIKELLIELGHISI